VSQVIDKVDVEAKELLDSVTAKMVEWEGKLVALGNAKDKVDILKTLPCSSICCVGTCCSAV
jgi:hypothetical protein